mgnify:FL=1
MILDFLHACVNLKKISRQGWIEKLSIDKPESVADHTFSMAMIGMVFSDLENYDSEKILKIILLHDLAESVTGDILPEKISRENKKTLEDTVIKNILGNLPSSLQKQYIDLWNDYQSNNSNESKIVHQIDKLEMALQAKIYSDDGYSKEKLSVFFDFVKKEITDPKLLDLFKKIS